MESFVSKVPVLGSEVMLQLIVFQHRWMSFCLSESKSIHQEPVVSD